MTSKAALERMVEAWREEHPEVLFTCLTLGPIESVREPDDYPASAMTEQAMHVITTMMPVWETRRLARPALADRQIAEQRRINERLAARNAALDAEVRDLKEGLGAIEERARSELGMVRHDEIFVQVLDTRQPRGDRAAIESSQQER